MAPRSHRAPSSSKTGISGGPQLTLAHLIVIAENILRIFARPLMLAAVFLAVSWFGFLPTLYPWMHLVALAVFILLFAQALGRARQQWKPVPFSAAKRRVEEASGLLHRPLDVLEDRPIINNEDQLRLWQMHADKARQQVKFLHWPKWKLSFADKDPYAVRYGLLIIVVVSLLFGWGALGGRILASINPALGKLHILSPTLDAWITPPEYTHLPPMMIATPAGMRHDGDTITIPEGSVITAHLAEKDGDTPDLIVNGESVAFSADDEHDFSVEETVHSGDKIAIRRGWQTLGSWRVNVVPDNAPQISLTEPPSATERKTIRLSYTATDDFGVTSVAARVIPRESLPGISNDPILIPLAAPDAKQVTRISFEDLTSHPWAGSPVQIQLIASDAAGHIAQTDPVDFTLPERIFVHPVARALIDERKRLLQTPDDDNARNEVANVMAGVAHQPDNYHGDPVVMMALRSGAVRLVLDRSDNVIEPVVGLLWQSAVRIEDGATGLAEQNLRKAQSDLAEALDRNASEEEIQKLIGQLHQALNQYLSELATHMASRPGPTDDLSQMLGPQTNMLTPKDLDRMLENMRNLSATGSREAARQQLSQLQQLLENMRTERPQFTAEQKEAMRKMLALRELGKQQQQLLDKTFQNAQARNSAANHKLATEQNSLLRQLQGLMHGIGGKPEQSLGHGAQAMGQASNELQQGMGQGAVRNQNDAVTAIQEALQGMAENLRSSMMQLPMPGAGTLGEGQDPFGRSFGARDDGSVKVPDQMEVRRVREILDELQRRSGDMNRPRIEREYIERLLQNF